MLLIFDIDGVLADCSHRLQLIPDWDAFFDAMPDDLPIQPMCKLLRCSIDQSVGVFLLTGRPGKYRPHTTAWIEEHIGLYEHDDYELIMRPEANFSSDAELKPLLFREACAPGDVIGVWADDQGIELTDEWLRANAVFFEDRDRVVAAWRGMGFCCLQPCEGAY